MHGKGGKLNPISFLILSDVRSKTLYLIIMHGKGGKLNPISFLISSDIRSKTLLAKCYHVTVIRPSFVSWTHETRNGQIFLISTSRVLITTKYFLSLPAEF